MLDRSAKIKELIKKGDAQFLNKNFEQALVFYQDAIELRPTSVEFLRKFIGTCKKAHQIPQPGNPHHFLKIAMVICNKVLKERMRLMLDLIETLTFSAELLELNGERVQAESLRNGIKTAPQLQERKANKAEKDSFVHDYLKRNATGAGLGTLQAAEHAYQGFTAFKQMNYANMLTSTKAAIALCSIDTSSYILQGWAHFKLGNFENALENFNTGLKMGQSTLGYFGRGLANYCLHGELNEFKEDFHFAIQKDILNRSLKKATGFMLPDEVLNVLTIFDEMEVKLGDTITHPAATLLQDADALLEKKQCELAIKTLVQARHLQIQQKNFAYTTYLKLANALILINKDEDAYLNCTIAIWLSLINKKDHESHDFAPFQLRKKLLMKNFKYLEAMVDHTTEALMKGISNENKINESYFNELYGIAKQHLNEKIFHLARYCLDLVITAIPKKAKQYISKLSDIADLETRREGIKIICETASLNADDYIQQSESAPEPSKKQRKKQKKHKAQATQFPPVRRVPASRTNASDAKDMPLFDDLDIDEDSGDELPPEPISQPASKGQPTKKELRRRANLQKGKKVAESPAQDTVESNSMSVSTKAEEERKANHEKLLEIQKKRAEWIQAHDKRIQKLWEERKAEAPQPEAPKPEAKLPAQASVIPAGKVSLDPHVKTYLLKMDANKTYVKGSYVRYKLLKKAINPKKDIDFFTYLDEKDITTREPRNRENRYIPKLFQHYSNNVRFETFKSTHADLLEEAKHADFTIGAIYLAYEHQQDIGNQSKEDKEGQEHGLVYDPLGIGLSDLEQGILRTIIPPRYAFTKDPVLMMRAIYFHVSEKMKLPAEMDQAIYFLAPLLLKLEPGRLNSWLWKIFSTKERGLYFKEMLIRNIFNCLFPVLMKSFIQDDNWILCNIANLSLEGNDSLQDLYLIFIVSAVMNEAKYIGEFVFCEAVIRNIIDKNEFFKYCFKEEYPRDKISNLGRHWQESHPRQNSFYFFPSAPLPMDREDHQRPGHKNALVHGGRR